MKVLAESSEAATRSLAQHPLPHSKLVMRTSREKISEQAYS